MPKAIFNNLRVGDCVLFGRYPQGAVEDGEVIRAFMGLCGKPSLRKSSPWVKYENCWGSGCVCDFAYKANKYRGLYTKSYKDEDPFYEMTGYPKGQVYVFAYEPVAWRVIGLGEGKALLLSERALDVQNFSADGQEETVCGKIVSSNNYEYSAVRAWLNGAFFQTAFTEEEKACVLPTTVPNGEETTKKQPNRFACADTTDRVFLLSFQEAFTLFSDNKERWRKATEYVKAQGGYAYGTRDAKYGNTCWWLRSPDHKYGNCVRCVGDGGGLGDGGFSTSNEPADAAEAVVPAIVVPIG